MKLTIVTLYVVWVSVVLTGEWLTSPQGSTVLSALILTLIPLLGTAINGYFTRRHIKSVEQKVDGAATALAESTKAAKELAAAQEAGRVKELEATIVELRKQIPRSSRSTDPNQLKGERPS
jgi:hypothetical protein